MLSFNILGNCRQRSVMIARRVNLIAVLSWLFLAAPAHVAQTPLDGHWQGMLLREGSEVKVSVLFKPTASGVEGTMTMLTLGMFRQPLSKISLNLPRLHFEQENLAAIFDGEVHGDQISGDLQIIGLPGKFYLKRSQDQPLPYKQEEVRFRNGNVTLGGTLT